MPNSNKPYTGNWEVFYPNGQIKKRGTFVDGKEDGIQSMWYKNGQKQNESIYKDGLINGLTVTWYENGQKDNEGIRRNSKNEGKLTFWYENGNKKWEQYYKNDMQDGISTSWYENGQKEFETHYKDDKMNGISISWAKDGSERRESYYKNGELIQTPQKPSVEIKSSTCESYSNLAKTVMTARQGGIPMSEVMNTISEITKQLAITAYEKPRFTSDGYKTKSIEDFRDKAYLDCVKAAR